MKHIGILPLQFDPQPLMGQLADCPQAWDTIKHRTEHPKSPHREVSDIWVRYNDLANYHGDMRQFNAAHESVWYPVIEDLPAILPLVDHLMDHLGAYELGGILITKIPAGKQVYPHVDQGWHAGHYRKVGMQLAGNDKQAFCFEDGALSALSGECYWFDNHICHWVRNDSREDRITLIVTARWGHTCH